ncbi:hypothetical protein B0H14DRAFT_2580630 [Mycena olivaceomarginata]|nr:hypothetical protein B0H14DRAFT_2580630 [Mycena olivaceomarginata]
MPCPHNEIPVAGRDSPPDSPPHPEGAAPGTPPHSWGGPWLDCTIRGLSGPVGGCFGHGCSKKDPKSHPQLHEACARLSGDSGDRSPLTVMPNIRDHIMINCQALAATFQSTQLNTGSANKAEKHDPPARGVNTCRQDSKDLLGNEPDNPHISDGASLMRRAEDRGAPIGAKKLGPKKVPDIYPTQAPEWK